MIEPKSQNLSKLHSSGDCSKEVGLLLQRSKLGNLTALLACIITCWVIRGEVTSAACLIKGGQHPYTGTGGPATVPASLQEDINSHANIQSELMFWKYTCFLLGATRHVDWNWLASKKKTHVYEMKRKDRCFLTWLDSLCSVLMPGRSCTDRRLGGSHVAADKKNTQERWGEASTG